MCRDSSRCLRCTPCVSVAPAAVAGFSRATLPPVFGVPNTAEGAAEFAAAEFAAGRAAARNKYTFSFNHCRMPTILRRRAPPPPAGVTGGVICTYIYTCICIHTYLYICMRIKMYVHIYTHMYIYIYANKYTCSFNHCTCRMPTILRRCVHRHRRRRGWRGC